MRVNRKALICAMLDADVKVSELASLANVSRNTISAIKNGKSASVQTVEKIAKALHVPAEQLMRKDEHKKERGKA